MVGMVEEEVLKIVQATLLPTETSRWTDVTSHWSLCTHVQMTTLNVSVKSANALCSIVKAHDLVARCDSPF